MNEKKPLDLSLFKNPTSFYKSAPFWAWNSKLNNEELRRQINILKEMGYGGFHMHVRTGMKTEYLSDEFFDHIKTCVDEAKKNNMFAYLYDEDRWPSGSAGGIVTKNESYRETKLLFTKDIRNDLIYLKSYNIILDKDGYLNSFNIVDNPLLEGNIWNAYIFNTAPSSWYNGSSYVDPLNKEAIDSFIDTTYKKYYDEVGIEFNKTIPSIFTDEPHPAQKNVFINSFDNNQLVIPWTKKLIDEYKNNFNSDIISNLPLLFYVTKDEKDKLVKYNYHILISLLFNKAYMNNIGNWCKENNIAFTGHLIEEPTLEKQSRHAEDSMYQYKDFDIPGVDMLQRKIEFATLKQCQSVVNQMDKKQMMSELYGVTSYEFDFRDYKLHGDFEAALGVTLRVPHLSWYSMNGEAKRDYPQSFNYQSPSYKELPYIENHFARLNTVLTRGKRIVKIGVVSPIESMYINFGPDDLTKTKRYELDKNFNDLTNVLLFNQLDFDYISEALLPEIENGTNVGTASYDCIILPFMETIRKSTIDFINKFIKSGKEVIIFGNKPRLINGVVNDCIIPNTTNITLSYSSLLENLEKYRTVSIKDLNGNAFNLIYQLREDINSNWLFISHAIEVRNKDISVNYDTHIKVKGTYKVSLFDTMSGNIKDIEHYTNDGYTYIEYKKLYEFDSVLLNLVPTISSEYKEDKKDDELSSDIVIPNNVEYILDEPNVLVLDRATLILDSKKEFIENDILKQDDLLRDYLGFDRRKKDICQPWATKDNTINHKVDLIFNFKSELELDNTLLALEEIDNTTIYLNDVIQEKNVVGYFTDKCIKTINLSKINKGLNKIKLTIDFNKLVNLENIFILGNFGVRLDGKYGIITELNKKIEFGDITSKLLPFYSGNITYIIPIKTTKKDILVHANYYKGSLLKASLDDSKFDYITLPPYDIMFNNIGPGNHILKIKLYGHKGNSFGPLHLMDYKQMPSAPSTFRTEGEKWSDEFIVRPIGLLKSPIIKERGD